MTNLITLNSATRTAMAPCTEIAVGDAWRQVCVASLIGHCESIAASGQLTTPSERSLRFLIAETLSAFGMQSHQQLENELSAIRQVMERA
jgi:hypothetical protein